MSDIFAKYCGHLFIFYLCIYIFIYFITLLLFIYFCFPLTCSSCPYFYRACLLCCCALTCFFPSLCACRQIVLQLWDLTHVFLCLPPTGWHGNDLLRAVCDWQTQEDLQMWPVQHVLQADSLMERVLLSLAGQTCPKRYSTVQCLILLKAFKNDNIWPLLFYDQ